VAYTIALSIAADNNLAMTGTKEQTKKATIGKIAKKIKNHLIALILSCFTLKSPNGFIFPRILTSS
jgi:hypothetical protein